MFRHVAVFAMLSVVVFVMLSVAVCVMLNVVERILCGGAAICAVLICGLLCVGRVGYGAGGCVKACSVARRRCGWAAVYGRVGR